MKKKFMCVLAVIFVFTVFTVQAFAKQDNNNVLSKIIINPIENNSYKLNLYFSDQFIDNAFIQKRNSGSYYVFLPSAEADKRIKIIYKDKKDSQNIKIKLDKKDFFTEDESLRLSIDMNNDYSIKILAKTADKKGFFSYIFNFYSLMLIVLIGFGVFLLKQIIKIANTQNVNYYTSLPSGFNIPLKKSLSKNKNINAIKNVTIPVNNIINTIKTSENDAFKCFDIPITEENKESGEFKDTLKQTSAILKEKTIKSKLTNPISKSISEDSSELKIPTIDEFKTEIVSEENEAKKPELLSVLNISPSKGFYLTTIDDTFALFGFVKDEVFLLTKFNDLTQINLQARFYDRNDDNDVYIVRLDSYKAMIAISDNGMKELAVL